LRPETPLALEETSPPPKAAMNGEEGNWSMRAAPAADPKSGALFPKSAVQGLPRCMFCATGEKLI
jgi:hypothetical protein